MTNSDTPPPHLGGTDQDSEAVTLEALRQFFVELAEKAYQGNLSHEDKEALYRLALSVAANEFYRIETEHGGEGDPIVKPEALAMLRQIGILTDQEALEDTGLVDPFSGESIMRSDVVDDA